MEIGNRVFYFKRDLTNINNIRYNRISGKIQAIFKIGKQLSAIDIEQLCGYMVGDPRFRKFYATSTIQKRILIKTDSNEYYLLEENLFSKNSFGSERYAEIVPNSIDFRMD